MKKNKLMVYLMALPLLLGLSSCGSSFTYHEGDTIYTKTPLIDLSNPGERLNIEVKLDGNIETIKIGRISFSNFGYKDGILTLDSSEFIKDGKRLVTSGEKTINITTSEKKSSLDILVCDKIIKTAQEFQDINNNLTGIYALGNDIDLSSITNFEPLGFFYDETNTKNSYFHGILDGNGYTVKNANVQYSPSETTNETIYNGTPLFKDPSHQAGDNIGIFQIIGSSGIVRNTIFKDCNVSARTIGGIIAGNNSGTIENCLVDGGEVNISTHFWDDDCNVGSVVGINAGSGKISNVISTGTSSVTGKYIDWSEDYVGKVAGSGEHVNDSDPYWTFYGGNKVKEGETTPYNDSNGHKSNGVYSFVGKSWGTVSLSLALTYKVSPVNGTTRDVDFGQIHKGENKPASGDTDLGELVDCYTKTLDELKLSATYEGFNSDIWNIKDGKLPNIKAIYPTK